MNSFSIRCTTCHASLVVRDEKAIGQILACPKCSSMVLIEQPPSASDGPAPVAKAEATLKPTPDNAFDDAGDLFDEQAADTTSESSAPTTTSDVDEEEHQRRSEETVVPVAAAAAIPTTPLPAANWTSPKTQLLRQYLLTGVAGIAGVSLAIGAIAFMLSRGGDTPDANDVATAIDATQNIEATTSDSDVATTSETNEADDATPANSNVDDVATLPSPEPVTPNVSVEETTSPAADVDEPTTSDPIVESGLPAPPDLDGPPDLLATESFLSDDPPVATPPVIESPTAPTNPPQPVVSSDTNTVAGRPEPRPRDVNVAAQLNVRLPAIQFTDTSLADFLAVMSRMSTVPITVDMDALAWARVGLETPVSVSQTDATVLEVLETTLKSIRLAAVVEANDVLVTVQSRSDAMKSVRFPVDDLVSDDDAVATTLLNLIQDVVAPSTWAVNGGNATIAYRAKHLDVSQTDKALLDALRLLEQLRIARGLPQKTSYPHELLNVESPTLLLQEKLTQNLSLNFSQSRQLPDILKRLGDEADLRIVVDWRMAGQMGWSPSTETTLVVEERSLHSSLTALLRPLKLDYVVVNSRAVEITSAEKVARKRRLEMYPVPTTLGPTAAELAARIRDSRELSDDMRTRIHYDRPSRHLIAWLTQAEHQTLAQIVHGLETE